MHSICLISCYMGSLPDYFGFFAATCKSNPTIHFIVINDSIEKSYNDANIEFIKADINNLNDKATKCLNEKITLANSWKINELKPAFGLMYADKLSSFDFWGWCDLDIIWGSIRNFLTPEILNEYDIITTKKNWCAGHFALFRNNDFFSSLFKRNEKISELLNSSTYFAFEESGHRWEGELYALDFLAVNKLQVSMFDIIKHTEKEGKLKALFKDVIREHPSPVNYSYKNGRLTDLQTRQEFLYYHLITVKKIWRFYIPKYKTMPTSLLMSPSGIKGENENRLAWGIKRSIGCMKGIKKSIKKQGLFPILKRFVTGNNK